MKSKLKLVVNNRFNKKEKFFIPAELLCFTTGDFEICFFSNSIFKLLILLFDLDLVVSDIGDASVTWTSRKSSPVSGSVMQRSIKPA